MVTVILSFLGWGDSHEPKHNKLAGTEIRRNVQIMDILILKLFQKVVLIQLKSLQSWVFLSLEYFKYAQIIQASADYIGCSLKKCTKAGQRTTNPIVKWIATNCIAEDVSVRNVLRIVTNESMYEPLSRHTITIRVYTLYKKWSTMKVSALQCAPAVTLSGDQWMLLGNHNYPGITVQWNPNLRKEFVPEGLS